MWKKPKKSFLAKTATKYFLQVQINIFLFNFLGLYDVCELEENVILSNEECIYILSSKSKSKRFENQNHKFNEW